MAPGCWPSFTSVFDSSGLLGCVVAGKAEALPPGKALGFPGWNGPALSGFFASGFATEGKVGPVLGAGSAALAFDRSRLILGRFPPALKETDVAGVSAGFGAVKLVVGAAVFVSVVAGKSDVGGAVGGF